MHADYVPNPLYDNNPFIEALPPMLSGKDLIRALAVIPPYSDSDRDRSTGERLQLLSSLYEFYQPLYTIKFHRNKSFICKRVHRSLYSGFRTIYIFCNFFHRPSICIITVSHCTHQKI